MTTGLPALGTDPRNPPGAPGDLETKGAELWTDVLARYSLRIDELVLLEQAARCVDDIERLRTALKDADLTVLGSMKQTVANPLLAELRLLRTTLASHLKQLGLPDETPTTGQGFKSPRHQRAARVRWANRNAAMAAEHARADQGGA